MFVLLSFPRRFPTVVALSSLLAFVSLGVSVLVDKLRSPSNALMVPPCQEVDEDENPREFLLFAENDEEQKKKEKQGKEKKNEKKKEKKKKERKEEKAKAETEAKEKKAKKDSKPKRAKAC